VLNEVAGRENTQFGLQQSRTLRTNAFQKLDLGMEEIGRQGCWKMVGFGSGKVL